MLNYYREEENIDFEALRLMITFEPSRVLSVLRKTRQRSTRRWEQEGSWMRVYYAAMAHKALRRFKQAEVLFRLAAGKCHQDSDKRECLRQADGLPVKL